MGSVAQIGLGIVILGAAFILGHYVNQNSIAQKQTQHQAEADDDIVWQSNQTVQELRDRLTDSHKAKPELAGPVQSQVSEKPKVPNSSMPIAGLNHRPVVRKPVLNTDDSDSSGASLQNPFTDSLSQSRLKAPTVPDELPPLKGSPGESRIIQPDFSGLIAAAEANSFAKTAESNQGGSTNPQPTTNPNKNLNTLPGSSFLPDNSKESGAVFKGDWVVDKETQLPKRDLTTQVPLDGNASRFSALNKSIVNENRPIQSEPVSTQVNALKAISRNNNSKITIDTDKFLSYQTRSSDTLQSISTRYFGKPDYYLDIYLANRESLLNPANVPTGIELRIPVYGD